MGEQRQAIGRSRGGRTTKIHALTDRLCRPLAFLLTGGQAADCKAGALLLERLPVCRIVLADKGYDSNAIRRQIEAAEAVPNIPPKINRRWKPCFSPVLYRGRNAIERMFGQLKDFRRIATRYDHLGDPLSRRRLPRRHRQLLAMSPEGSASIPPFMRSNAVLSRCEGKSPTKY